MGDPRFPGKVAIVTGGARGLGRALVGAFAAHGAAVAFSYHEGPGDNEAAALVGAGLRVVAIRANAREPGAMNAFVQRAVSSLGPPDILVNNIGVFREASIETVTEELLDEAFDVNVKAAVMTSQAAAPHMRRRGTGAIVNVASLGAWRPWRSHLPYSISKAALAMATECLALALAPEIRVNAVAPGILDPPGAAAALRQKIPLGRFGSHADVVNTVLFLASDESTYLTGQLLGVDGGRGLA
jgi:NAD(P)-dependent dehydrogenase (short-subunit alcohol dehydrogenase family)